MKKILSTTLVRVLALICGLFGCTLTGYAYYDEAIIANQEFYIYNVANGKYLQNNNGGLILVNDIADASSWKFSGTSGDVTVENGSYYLTITRATGTGAFGIEKDPGDNAKGTVTLSTSSSKFTLSGDINGYTMSVKYSYVKGFGRKSRSFYFSNTIEAIQTQSNATKWKVISKRQVDNTISLSPSPLTLEAIQGAPAVEKQFDVNHNGAPTTITLTNGSTSLTINSPTKPAPINVAFQVAEDGSKTIIISNANDASKKATYSFGSSESASVTLTVSTTAASGNAIDADKKTITITGNVVTLKEQYIDWTQDFSALAPTSTPITLNAIAKDKNGDPTGRTITYTLASSGVVKIVDGKLYVLAEGITSIKASVASDAEYVGTEKTLAIKVSGVATDNITKSNAATTGLCTGTVGGPSASYIFHRGITPIDLSRCFNEEGTALFDTLYIFGITSNTDGELITYMGTDEVEYASVPLINTPSSSVGCNATTPCYVYKKINETTYSYHRTFDATQKRYDWKTEQNGKHLYFTGYCPFAYMGVTPTAEGWMYFKGGDTTLDIYLDNCEIMGRYKTQTGKNSGYENYTVILDVTELGEENPNDSFMSGASSPFVFTSTTKKSGESYKPTIHIAGRNHLQGQLGSYISKVIGKAKLYGIVETELDAGIDPVYTYSSPITIKPTDLGHKTDLVMTDIWKDNTITNGYLHLDATKPTNSNSEKVVAVDLGSPNGSLTINGGQYHLRNAAADGTYACNMAVAYRVFSKVAEKSGAKAWLRLYGFGGDMADCKVIINSGTFTMYKNVYQNGTKNGKPVYLGVDYYKDQDTFMDLRLPAGDGDSQINGGTFNGISHVFMCTQVITTGASPINGQGEWLCLQDVEVKPEKTSYGSATFDIPSPFDLYEDPMVSYSLVDDNMSSVAEARQYGGQSANAYEKDGKQIVRLLLSGAGAECDGVGACENCEKQEETIIYQWVTAIPKFDGQKEIDGKLESISVGGATRAWERKAEGQIVADSIVKQLLYLDCEGIEDYSWELHNNGSLVAKIVVNEEYKSTPRGKITNTESYEIEKNLNMLKTVQADTWYTFTAPFDVHDVSVVETNETTISAKKREQAIEQQAQDNLQILYDLQNFIIPTEEGRASSLTLTDLLKANSSMRRLVRQPLTHYDGTNVMDAHYYLYELDIKDGETEFKTDGTGETLDIKWKPVAKQNSPTDPILEAGKVYAMQFPWCPMCNDLYVDDPAKKRTYYDYWSNKLILFHGNGPQTVAGTDYHSSILATTPAEGYATLVGNSTLADMTLDAADKAYVHNMANDYFELNNADDYPLKPTEGFMLYNPGASPMPARISRSGQIEYDENAETGVDGVPTVGDRTSLMLFGAYDGFEVLALHEQLVTVYNLQGNIIFQQYMTAGEQVYMATGAGIYVVRGESEAIKVMIE